MITFLYLLCYFVGLTFSAVTPTQLFKVKNIFKENVKLNINDLMECKIKSMDTEKLPTNEIFLYTPGADGNGGDYSYYPLKENAKCLVFNVKAKDQVHIAFSAEPRSNVPNFVDLVIALGADTVFRKSAATVAKVTIPDLVSPYETRTFRVSWPDDYTIEVQRSTESKPFMVYRNNDKFNIKVIGFLTWKTSGTWSFYNSTACDFPQTQPPSPSNDLIVGQSECWIKPAIDQNTEIGKKMVEISSLMKTLSEVFDKSSKLYSLNEASIEHLITILQKLFDEANTIREKTEVSDSANDVYTKFRELFKLYLESYIKMKNPDSGF